MVCLSVLTLLAALILLASRELRSLPTPDRWDVTQPA
jgi:hypothetical protein